MQYYRLVFLMQLHTLNKALSYEGDSVSQWKECRLVQQTVSNPNFTTYQILGKSLNSVTFCFLICKD